MSDRGLAGLATLGSTQGTSALPCCFKRRRTRQEWQVHLINRQEMHPVELGLAAHSGIVRSHGL